MAELEKGHTMDEELAFAIGFMEGASTGEASPRESEDFLRPFVSDRAPTVGEIEAFGQGTVDGAARDTFRLIEMATR